MECGAIVGQRRTRPGVAPEMEGVLMPFSFILVLEAVFAILAFILLLLFMRTTGNELVFANVKRFTVPTSGLLPSQISLASLGSIHR